MSLRQRRSKAGPPEVYDFDLTKQEPPSNQEPPADHGADAEPSGGSGFLSAMLVPDAALVPAEYWSFRWLTTLLGLISTVKGALTAQAHMIAIGVGDGNATPLNYLVISEINAAVRIFLSLFAHFVLNRAQQCSLFWRTFANIFAPSQVGRFVGLALASWV